jgi:hypothetical protein
VEKLARIHICVLQNIGFANTFPNDDILCWDSTIWNTEVPTLRCWPHYQSNKWEKDLCPKQNSSAVEIAMSRR